MEKDRSKRKSREMKFIVVNIHYKCMTYDHSTVRHAYLYTSTVKLGREGGGIPVNSNLPAVTCMSTLDKMIPATQICHDIGQ